MTKEDTTELEKLKAKVLQFVDTHTVDYMDLFGKPSMTSATLATKAEFIAELKRIMEE